MVVNKPTQDKIDEMQKAFKDVRRLMARCKSSTGVELPNYYLDLAQARLQEAEWWIVEGMREKPSRQVKSAA